MKLKLIPVNIIKLFTLFSICAVFIAGAQLKVFASELPPELASRVTKIESGSIILDATEEPSIGVLPRWSPGDGPAPQVSKILLYDIVQFNDTGNLGVITQVWGYGKEFPNAKINGMSIDCVEEAGFIDYGVGYDGFYHLYDCEIPVAPGSYTFSVNYRSNNPPYRELGITVPFSLGLN